MWALFVNSSNSEVSYKDKNDVEKTTPIISRIGSKGNVLKYTAFEEPIKFSGKWELDSWATFKVEIEPLGEGTYTVTTYKADGIDGYIFTELYSRTITSADGTFTGAISDIGFVSGTQTSDSIPMYVKSYKVEILN